MNQRRLHFSFSILLVSLFAGGPARATDANVIDHAPECHFVQTAVGSPLGKDFLFFSQPSERKTYIEFVKSRGFTAASVVELPNIEAPSKTSRLAKTAAKRLAELAKRLTRKLETKNAQAHREARESAAAPGKADERATATRTATIDAFGGSQSGAQLGSPSESSIASLSTAYEVQVEKLKVPFLVGLEGNRIQIANHLVSLSTRVGSMAEKMMDDFDAIHAGLLLALQDQLNPDSVKVRGPASIAKLPAPEPAIASAIANAAVAIQQTSILYISQMQYRHRVWDELCDQGNNLKFSWNWESEAHVRSKVALVDSQVGRPYFYGLTVQNANASFGEWTKLKCDKLALNDTCTLLQHQLACFERILKETPKSPSSPQARLTEDDKWQVQPSVSPGPWTFISNR